MTFGLMCLMHRRSRLLPSRFAQRRNRAPQETATLSKAFPSVFPQVLQGSQRLRGLASIQSDRCLSDVWFNSSPPQSSVKPAGLPGNGPDEKPPDERTLKLGKSMLSLPFCCPHPMGIHLQFPQLTQSWLAIRVLHENLPTLLASPLPQEILSPQITLHLFPSTHPHLPTVSGRIAYCAALWTAPVAWGRVPVVGNVRLSIISERLVKNGSASLPSTPPCASGNECLVVRWKTCGKTKGRGMGSLYRGIYGKGDQVDKITEFLGGDARDDEEFSGLFIFEFDLEGRIVSHTIEHAQQGGNWEKMTRVVNVTDWLLGRTKWKRAEDEPGLALGFCDVDQQDPNDQFERDRRNC